MSNSKPPADLFGTGQSIYADDGVPFDTNGEFDSANYTKGASSSQGSYVPYKRCYESHKPLALGGGTFIGGSCGLPVTDDADVYIGLQSGMKVQNFKPGKKPPTHIAYYITDMCAPPNSKEFQELIDLCVGYLAMGKTIHVGCIGGHGRTGTFLAALVKAVNGTEDAITWARENYCVKAVESQAQIDFLHEHWGIKKVAGSKQHLDYSKGKTHGKEKSKGNYNPPPSHWPKASSKEIKNAPVAFKGSARVFQPVASKSALLQAQIL